MRWKVFTAFVKITVQLVQKNHDWWMPQPLVWTWVSINKDGIIICLVCLSLISPMFKIFVKINLTKYIISKSASLKWFFSLQILVDHVHRIISFENVHQLVKSSDSAIQFCVIVNIGLFSISIVFGNKKKMIR